MPAILFLIIYQQLLLVDGIQGVFFIFLIFNKKHLMKTIHRNILIFIMSILYFGAFAQFSKIIVFAPKGDKFTLSVGGSIQNSTPEDRVEADVPGGPTFKIKVTFSDPSIKELSKLVFNKPDQTFYYKVDKNPKGVYVLESTSSEWSDVNATKEEVPPPAPKDQKAAPATENVKTEKTAGGTGCSDPMDEAAFVASLVSVSAPPFDPPKLSAAKKLATEHCLTTTQVKGVIYVFDNESTRLSFAKFAYDHTWDPQNYSDVAEALNSSKSKKELEDYIGSKK